MTTKPVRKTTSPIVDGQKTTYADLATALGLTRAGAQYRYLQAKRVHGTVTSDHLAQPVEDPAKILLRTLRAKQEANQRIYKFAIMHGPTHAAQHFNMPVDEVRSVLGIPTQPDK